MSTDAHNILAAHLGLGDQFPTELGRMVDAAFWRNHDPQKGRHAVGVTLNLSGSEVVQGHTYEGDDVQVVATATTEDRTITEQLPLADLWRWSKAGLELLEVQPAVEAIAYYGLAETVDADGAVWTSIVTDQRGAPVVLINPETFAALMTSGNDVRRVNTVRGNVEGTQQFGVPNVRAVAATSAREYLARQQEDPTDDGMTPLWWAIYRLPEVVSSSGAPAAAGKPRHYALRGTVASEVTRDATGKARIWAKGSTWSARQLPASVDGMAPIRGEEEDDDDPGSVGRPPSTKDGHLTEWSDTTGETGAKLADGDVTLAEVAGKTVLGHHKAFTPQSAGWRTAFGSVIDLLLEIGLTERQAFMLANAESGFSHADIALEFNCAVSTVTNTLQAAREKVEAAKHA